MRRRQVLRWTAVSVAGAAGCLGAVGADRETPTVSGTVEERVVECERRYLDDRIGGDDESVVDRSGPTVVATEAREDGDYLELETTVGTVRSREGEPDEHRDYFVAAAYLVTDGAVYRTEGLDADGAPREGTTVDC